ncbi:hypothetical protein [Candidatus Tisiphia endosymbiont of Hybos culiciformis]
MNNKNINKWTNSSKSAIVLQKTYGTPFVYLQQNCITLSNFFVSIKFIL